MQCCKPTIIIHINEVIMIKQKIVVILKSPLFLPLHFISFHCSELLFIFLVISALGKCLESTILLNSYKQQRQQIQKGFLQKRLMWEDDIISSTIRLCDLTNQIRQRKIINSVQKCYIKCNNHIPLEGTYLHNYILGNFVLLTGNTPVCTVSSFY